MENNTHTPLVSLIVRTKDRPKLLEHALESIAAQTYRPIEVVLVNDGGCDLNIEKLNSILGDVSLNYIRLEKNTGRAHAGNVGIEHAKGDYIGFLDDDDALYPEHIDTLVTFLNQSDYKVAYTDTEMISEDLASEEKRGEVTKKIFSKDFSYADLLIVNYIPFNSLLFSKVSLSEDGRIDEKFELYEDWDFLIRIGQRYPFYHIKKITAKYRQWSRDLQINQSAANLMETMRLFIIGKHREKITPEIILHMHNEKERLGVELKNSADRYELAVIQGSGHVLQPNEVAWEKDNHILTLNKLIREKEHYISQLEKLMREKNNHMTQLEHNLNNLNNNLNNLNNDLNLIKETMGWKVLEKLREVREKALPPVSRRRRLYDLAIKSIKVMSEEGPKKFFAKVENKLRYSAHTQGELFKKANTVLRIYGARTFLKYTYQYLIHGRSSFKVINAYSQDAYEQWIERNEKRDERMIRKEIERLGFTPKISIITPVYNVDAKWLNRCIESVITQFYENWELCIHDDASTNKETLSCLEQWMTRDKRIKVTFGKVNLGISDASNQALKSATGEFVALLDNDDELSPGALYENVKLLNAFPDTDLIYSDEDRIVETGKDATRRYDPFFKPDWSPQLLFACMYTGHLSVYRKSLIDEAGGFRSEFDFSQDYDLALRITERTDRIKHIQKVLYHWRAIPGSAAADDKHFARRSNIRALESAVERRGYDAKVMEYPFANRVKFNLWNYPLVSIIIPTDNKKNILNCIELLLENTSYPNFEIIVVTNPYVGEEILIQYSVDKRVRISVFDKPFNFSLKCNEGASAANGEYLLFLNDDVEAIEDTWLETMVGVFGKGKVGGVSPKLFYENDTIQYAGMITGVRDFVGTAFHCQPKDSGFYFNFIQSERNVSLLTGACLLIPKSIFFEVGGFDVVNTPIMHSDIDLCFRLKEKGYELIYTPFASLRHIGHLSLREASEKQLKRKDNAEMFILKKWGDYLSRDPFYTENMRALLYQGGSYYYSLIAGRQEDDFLSSRNILFVTHDLSLSGAPLLMYNLALYMKKHGYFVTIMSPYHGELADKYTQENIPLIIDSTIAECLSYETEKLISQFDLVVVNTMLMWRFVFGAKDNSIPVIWIIHESLAGKRIADGNTRASEALKIADDVIFACNATAALYERHNVSENFRIMNYGTEPLSARNVSVKKNENFSILHIGSIEPRKGQDILIKSIMGLPPKYAEGIQVFMVGRTLDNEESREFYRAIVKTLKSNERIHLLGQIPHENVVEIIAQADLFVCSSRDEVFPLTILEAMSVGKPILSTDVGGVSEMIRNNEDGFIVSKEDSKALAEKIMYLFDYRQELGRLGENARERFYANFTMERFGGNMLVVIKRRIESVDKNIQERWESSQVSQ